MNTPKSPEGKVTLYIDGKGVEIDAYLIEHTGFEDGDNVLPETPGWLWRIKNDPKSLADDMYPRGVTYGGNIDHEVETTEDQRIALFRKWKQDDQGISWNAFARTVQPSFGMDGAIVVPWCGMFLAIEKDGYTHS